MAEHGILRYSDEELEEFRALITQKYEQAKEQLTNLSEQIMEITENTSDDHGGDWMDDSSINNEVEMLNTMAIRQRTYIKDLENALIRIKNKSYGICVVTGELIEKRRLLAVPTTTKSVMAKNDEKKVLDEKQITKPTKNPYVRRVDADNDDEIDGDEEEATPKPKPKATPVIITKVIRKSGGNKPAKLDDDEEIEFAPPYDDDDFDLVDDKDDDDDNNDDDIDFDNIADTDSSDDDDEEY